ncbi:MAG: hypothetical protein JSS81_24100 [Acidobacteria bacterium]|nr:hypothetical protein [Acidobacteriota bacterium]MBS1796930.1 hypothetical protein [Acidobacteriota bacterium]
MALIETIENREYANVGAPVGAMRALNNPDDVMIVQALMMTIALHCEWFDVRMLSAPYGTFDEKTAKGITRFQNYAQRELYGRRMFIAQDGRVSPARGRKQWGTNCLWTIIALNDVAAFYLEQSGIAVSPVEYITAAYEQVRQALGSSAAGKN